MVMPTKYRPELIAEICDRLATGESIRSITTDAEMPSWKTIRTWLREKEGFHEEYNRSKKEGVEYILSDNRKKCLDTYDRSKNKGSVGLEETHALKLLMHDAHWTASKLVPKVYGDKTQQEIVGADRAPLVIQWKQ